MKLRDFLICFALMLPVVVLLLPLRAWWFLAVLEGRSFPATSEWLNLAELSVWAFEFAWSLVVGVVVAFFDSFKTSHIFRGGVWRAWGVR